MKEIYTSTDNKEFEKLAEYAVNDSTDIWVEYRNCQTKEIYTCKKAAFEQRFCLRLQS